MRVELILLLGLVAALVVLCYALVVMASEADRRAERMYQKWREQLKYDMENNGEPIDGDYNIGIDHAICVLEAMKGADRKTESNSEKPNNCEDEPNLSEIPSGSTISKMEQVDKDINVRSKERSE